jgi:hypothetical protein
MATGKVWSGVGLPVAGDYLNIKIPLKRVEEKYKDKNGIEKVFVKYAQVGSKFGGQKIGDGSLAIKFTIYPPASSSSADSDFELIG